MVKDKKRKKPPSRKKYEEEHPTLSFRLDRETREHLKEHLAGTGCSVADFVKDNLGREESMVEKRVEILASRQMDPSAEYRLRCLEDLVYYIVSLGIDTREFPPYCPRCEGQELFMCESREMESTIADPWVPTWKCPKCGFFLNTYKRLDPKSIKWIDPDRGGYTNKPKPSTRQ